ncbi:MAG: DUF2569 family protein [Gemmatimonadales bacterium]|uniref:DUF2569 family protein n=1 Tax=Candidatus Palauibacter polyketidifaciens TaxID=3056740 RepID=UPI0013F6FE9A|nr:DUF2569 family protein [Candidatus Palauibacter polyketidifaciens]MDE2719748.1 DUF2569 family protein [Candidatus Palauibacter polyketidifaciens]MYC89224.1 DUF2569 family protein [Candidatus Palauibacter denitrificans]
MGPAPNTETAIDGTTPVGVGGWLLVYLGGSIPFLLVHAAGLSGWFLDYALWLLVAIFLVLASPLALILLKSPRAPTWNVVALWVVALVITLRAAAVPFNLETDGTAQRRNPEEWVAAIAILAAIVVGSLAWATIWTAYFRRSLRVRNTFRPQ